MEKMNGWNDLEWMKYWGVDEDEPDNLADEIDREYESDMEDLRRECEQMGW